MRYPVHGGAYLLTALVAVAAITFGGCGDRSGSEILLEVDGKPITRGQLEAELTRRYGALALKTLVDRKIVEQLAAEKRLAPETSRVEAKLRLAESQAGGRGALAEKLEKSGKSLERLRAELANEALADQLVAAEVTVSEDEVKQYYADHRDDYKHGEMVHGRLMLFESRQNAEEVHKVLDEPGADFAGLAEALSVDPGTKDERGDMGWIERGDYASEITDAAFKLQPGRHSDVIDYADGFAIVRVEGRKPPGYRPLGDVRDEVESIIRRDKEAELRAKWAIEQRKRADIRVVDSELAERFELIRGR